MGGCACSKGRFARAVSTFPSLHLKTCPRQAMTSRLQAISDMNDESSIQQDYTHLILHVLSVIFPVDLARRGFTLNPKCGVTDLGGKAIDQVKKTCLTNILDFGACLADNGGLESHAGARVPTKDGEGASAGATGAPKLLF